MIIHVAIIHIPRYLYQTWNKECYDYLKITQPRLKLRPLIQSKSKKTISYKTYFPFFSSPFFFIDLALFFSSMLIFYFYPFFSLEKSYLNLISFLFFTYLLLINAGIDIEHHILSDEITYIILWSGLISHCFYSETLALSLLTTVSAYLILWAIALLFKIIRKKEGLGQGDVKLFAALAAWIPALLLPWLLLIASGLSLCFILLRKLFKKKAINSPIAFGPFLAFSAWIILLWENNLKYLFFS